MIITVEDIRKVRPIADNLNDEKRLLPYIDECEKLFLIPAIGASLYKKINDNISEYEELLSGGYYDNDTKYFNGLRQAMGYLVYSRFVRNQNVNATAFGMVFKEGQFSEKVDEKTIVRIANDAEKIGLRYLSECVEYLNYSSDSCETKQVIRNKKFRVIGD